MIKNLRVYVEAALFQLTINQENEKPSTKNLITHDSAVVYVLVCVA